MNIFANTATAVVPTFQAKGGLPETGVYPCELKVAYLAPNSRNAKAIDCHVTLELPTLGYTHKESFYSILVDGSPMVEYRGKQQTAFSFVKLTRLLGAFTKGSDLSTLGQFVKEKSIEVYDFDSRSNVVKPMQVFDFPQKVTGHVALTRKISNKWDSQAKAETAEKTTKMVVSIAGDDDRLSYDEIREGKTEPKNFDTWLKANDGKDWDTYKAVGGGTAGATSVVSSTPANNVFGS